MNTEPLDDGPCHCGDPACPCGKCHGVGWAQVGPSYPLQQVPDAPMDLMAQLDEAGQMALLYQLGLARAAAADSWYPCRACNESLFYRWRGGHLASDHDRGSCPECQDKGVARRRRVHA